jgi:hypothetical protein
MLADVLGTPCCLQIFLDNGLAIVALIQFNVEVLQLMNSAPEVPMSITQEL